MVKRSRSGLSPVTAAHKVGRAIAATYRTAVDSVYGVKGMTADNAHSRKVRERVRNASRVESQENAYYIGAQRTQSNLVIGTGPTLQVQINRYIDETATPEAKAKAKTAAREVEAAWQDFVEGRGLIEKMRTMERTFVRDPSAIAVITTDRDPNLDKMTDCVGRKLPPLDWQLLDDERVRNDEAFGTGLHRILVSADGNTITFAANRDEAPPAGGFEMLVDNVDGVLVSTSGDIVAYQISEQHPNAQNQITGPKRSYKLVPAKYVIHLYERDRMEQHRGMPAGAVGLFAASLWKRFTEAVIKAYTNAACMSVIFTTMSIPDEDDEAVIESPEMYEEVTYEPGMSMTAPDGYDAHQMKIETPNAQFGEVEDRQLRQIGRPLGMGIGELTGDYSKFNYSSARMGNLMSRVARHVRRQLWQLKALDNTFAIWWKMVTLVRDAGYLSVQTRAFFATLTAYPPAPSHVFHWPELDPLDEIKTATAVAIRMKTGQSNIRRELARAGIDFDDMAEEMSKDYGLPIEGIQKLLMTSIHAIVLEDLIQLDATFEAGSPRDIVEAFQKIYLAVGDTPDKVLERDEARRIINETYGGNLDLSRQIADGEADDDTIPDDGTKRPEQIPDRETRTNA